MNNQSLLLSKIFVSIYNESLCWSFVALTLRIDMAFVLSDVECAKHFDFKTDRDE